MKCDIILTRPISTGILECGEQIDISDFNENVSVNKEDEEKIINLINSPRMGIQLKSMFLQ